MRLRNEAKVGLIVFAGIVALIFVYWFLGGLQIRAASYPIFGVFPSAHKLSRGAMVRMAGVEIGIVKSTSLVGTRARVDMLIDKEVCIPRDSVARITTGGFIGENYMEITPGDDEKCIAPRSRVRTAEIVQPEQIMEQASVLLSDLRQSVRSVNEILGDRKALAAIRQTISQLRDAARSASQMMATSNALVGNLGPRIGSVMSEFEAAASNASKATSQIERLVAEDVRPNTRTLLRQAGSVAENLDAAAAQARELLAALSGRAGNLDDAFAKVSESLDNVAAATSEARQLIANLNQASIGFRDIATDQQLQRDLRTTLSNAAEASAQARDLIDALNRRLGRKSTATPVDRSAVPENGATVNALWNTATGNYRFDTYYTYFGGGGSVYRAGAYDVGEDTKAVLQLGKLLGKGSALRYGLYASRLGIGYDRRIGRNGLLSADVFRPNEPQMEIRGAIGIRGPWGVYAGVADVFHEENRDVLVGVRYQD